MKEDIVFIYIMGAIYTFLVFTIGVFVGADKNDKSNEE